MKVSKGIAYHMQYMICCIWTKIEGLIFMLGKKFKAMRKGVLDSVSLALFVTKFGWCAIFCTAFFIDFTFTT